MLHKKKSVILMIAFVSLTGILLFICFIHNNNNNNNPVDIIKSKINLTLPTTSKFIHFNYNVLTGDFNGKVQINDQDVERIKDDLLEYFGQEYDFISNEYLPNINNSVSWWDIDKKNIEVCYETFIDGKKHWFIPSPKTFNLWAFIVKQNDRKYYLYISCF